ncbi:MAG: hypothetical protein ACYDCK_14605 [Thermoplasmatota archaeon]
MLPSMTRSVRAHASCSPPQQMGLEFHHPRPNEDHRETSWNDSLNAALLSLDPPIDMTIKNPEGGLWWTYLGPGVAGGDVTWTLTLTIEVPQGENARVQPG